MRIHLTIMQPHGYVHSLGFLDQARYARYQFRRMGAEVSIGKNRLREDSVNLIFGAHLGFPVELKDRYTCIFFNLEQLGDGGAKVSAEYMNLLATSAVIDYDERNLAAYGCKSGDVPVVTFLHAPYLATHNLIPLQDRPIDLLFFGSMNERRKALISRIEACGWNVSLFDKPLYGEERDHFIRQSKAVLNCHFYETSRFEQARAFHSLSLGTPLLSEKGMRTQPPASYESVVSWFSSESLESFFQDVFMTAEWLEQASVQLDKFKELDSSYGWAAAAEFCQALQSMDISSGRIQSLWQPKAMNLGSGKDYKPGWLNIDVLERAQPDIVIDLACPIELPALLPTLGGGRVLLAENGLDYIHANNVLEHVPDLPCLMTNLLALLADQGVLDIEVPYEKAPSAWQDPTHLRAMNKNSWIYYTDWFWYLGWFEHRFQMISLQWLDSHHAPCDESYAAFMKVKLQKIETTLNEKSFARTVSPDFCGIPEDF